MRQSLRQSSNRVYPLSSQRSQWKYQKIGEIKHIICEDHERESPHINIKFKSLNKKKKGCEGGNYSFSPKKNGNRIYQRSIDSK